MLEVFATIATVHWPHRHIFRVETWVSRAAWLDVPQGLYHRQQEDLSMDEDEL